MIMSCVASDPILSSPADIPEIWPALGSASRFQSTQVRSTITTREFAANVQYRDLAEGEHDIGGVRVRTMLLSHPGNCLGYRLEYAGRRLCYVTDNELYPKDSPFRSDEYVERLVDFCRDANVLITDCTYADEEYARHMHWGHSSVSQAAELAWRARERSLARSYFPQVTLQSAFSGRGTGADVPGLPSLGNGLWLQVPNWAVGASVTFPVFDIWSINARKRVELQNELAERARYERTIQALTTQELKARALMKAATEIARNTPIERQAATAGESQARARYQNGLASVVEVAEAQRLLAQAEADDAVARLGVWRALLATMQAHGDLAPFLDKIRQ